MPGPSTVVSLPGAGGGDGGSGDSVAVGASGPTGPVATSAGVSTRGSTSTTSVVEVDAGVEVDVELGPSSGTGLSAVACVVDVSAPDAVTLERGSPAVAAASSPARSTTTASTRPVLRCVTGGRYPV